MNGLVPWRQGGQCASAHAAAALALLLLFATQVAAQQVPQPTVPRAPLGPGSEMSRPSEPRPRPRMAPQHDESDRPMGPKARQDHQLELFRSGLARALNRSSAVAPPAKGVLIVNTSDGPFAGVLELPGGDRRRFRVDPFGQLALPCEECGDQVRMRFHDGYDGSRNPAFDHGSRAYIIVNPMHGRFEIISQEQTIRLARIPQ